MRLSIKDWNVINLADSICDRSADVSVWGVYSDE